MSHHSYITSLAQLSNCYNTVDKIEVSLHRHQILFIFFEHL